MYKDIEHSRIKSLRLLLRTVHKSFGGHGPAHALHFTCYFMQFLSPLGDKVERNEYPTLAGEIVACCPELRHLAGHHNPLHFTSDTSLPEYSYLKMLKSFKLLWGKTNGDQLDHCLVPSFTLSTLSIAPTSLSLGQCKWLFGSSFQSIESLKVDEVSGASLGYLCKVIRGCLRNVRLKHLVFYDTMDALFFFVSSTIIIGNIHIHVLAGAHAERADAATFELATVPMLAGCVFISEKSIGFLADDHGIQPVPCG
ncbi:uncharacterized protein EDB91DRAFT_1247688 [Suillus paluster]|uniref:uncharacterized protein n=1 Tax=Suillus paluster TaxID=48578 RepID=UPI001B87B180|nr:uncharacterized protein EDB91DRAFT_1247688 [Suillus paluster]KAG1742287.1 hypothetical protein EDB91DRAFT_1247688 [Suillus paluster]